MERMTPIGWPVQCTKPFVQNHVFVPQFTAAKSRSSTVRQPRPVPSRNALGGAESSGNTAEGDRTATRQTNNVVRVEAKVFMACRSVSATGAAKQRAFRGKKTPNRSLPILVFGVLQLFLLRSRHERVQVLLPALCAALAVRRTPRWPADPVSGLQASDRHPAVAQSARAREHLAGIRQDVGDFHPPGAQTEGCASGSINFATAEIRRS